MAERGAAPVDTGSLIEPFLSKLEFPPALKNNYEQRLRYGLENYYLNHYYPENNEN
jgi:hypothetical protein